MKDNESNNTGSVNPDSNEPRGAQSISRAIKLLYAVGRHNENGIRLSVLAREEKLTVSTVKRILSSLANEGFISYDPVTMRYRLGFGLYSLGQSALQYAITDQLRPVMEKIAAQTEDSVFLLIHTGLDTLCIERIEGKYPIRASTVKVGTRRPIGTGAASIAMLAEMPADRAKKLINANRKRYESFDNITIERVERLVNEAQERGYAVFDRHTKMIFTAVALPILKDEGDPVAAIGVSAIHKRMTAERQKQIIAIMHNELSDTQLVF
jgi:DNA-binding IclR family transcriptional regulator